MLRRCVHGIAQRAAASGAATRSGVATPMLRTVMGAGERSMAEQPAFAFPKRMGKGAPPLDLEAVEAENKITYKKLISAVEGGNPGKQVDVDRFLWDCHTMNDVKRAEKLLWAYSPIKSVMGLQTGAHFIKACVRAGDLDRAMTAMRDHRQLRFHLTRETSNQVLVALGKAKRIDDFDATLKLMRNLVPTSVCDITLLVAQRAFCVMGEFERAAKLMSEYMALGVVPNKVCVRLLLNTANQALDAGGEAAAGVPAARDLVRALAAKDTIASELIAYVPAAPAAAPAAEAAAEGAEGGEKKE